MKLVLAADHAGFPLKQHLVTFLRAQGHDIVDLGISDGSQPADYPDPAKALGLAIQAGEAERGILRQRRRNLHRGEQDARRVCRDLPRYVQRPSGRGTRSDERAVFGRTHHRDGAGRRNRAGIHSRAAQHRRTPPAPLRENAGNRVQPHVTRSAHHPAVQVFSPDSR
jgi:hypothetical protein